VVFVTQLTLVILVVSFVIEMLFVLVYIDSFCVVTVAVWRDQMTN